LQAGKKMLIAIGVDIANRQALKHMKKTGKVEGDALASMKKKK
jgi:hypothetical protein